MTEAEEKAQICRELALAIGYVMDIQPYGKRFRYRLTPPDWIEEAMRSRAYFDSEEEAWSDWSFPRFFTEWRATGALMEWAYRNSLIIQQSCIEDGDGLYIPVFDARNGTSHSGYGAFERRAQEAITRAIYAAVKSRSKP